jgi:hypothetical protein
MLMECWAGQGSQRGKNLVGFAWFFTIGSAKVILFMRLLCLFAAIVVFQSVVHATGCSVNLPCAG